MKSIFFQNYLEKLGNNLLGQERTRDKEQRKFLKLKGRLKRDMEKKILTYLGREVSERIQGAETTGLTAIEGRVTIVAGIPIWRFFKGTILDGHERDEQAFREAFMEFCEENKAIVSPVKMPLSGYGKIHNHAEGGTRIADFNFRSSSEQMMNLVSMARAVHEKKVLAGALKPAETTAKTTKKSRL